MLDKREPPARGHGERLFNLLAVDLDDAEWVAHVVVKGLVHGRLGGVGRVVVVVVGGGLGGRGGGLLLGRLGHVVVAGAGVGAVGRRVGGARGAGVVVGGIHDAFVIDLMAKEWCGCREVEKGGRICCFGAKPKSRGMVGRRQILPSRFRCSGFS